MGVRTSAHDYWCTPSCICATVQGEGSYPNRTPTHSFRCSPWNNAEVGGYLMLMQNIDTMLGEN